MVRKKPHFCVCRQKKSDSREVKCFKTIKKNGGEKQLSFLNGEMCQRSPVFEARRLLRDALGAEEACVFVCARACLCKQKVSEC